MNNDIHAPSWEQKHEVLHIILQQSRFGLICDFDGTLSPFAPTPDQAVITPEIAALLDALASRVTIIALVSGRSARGLRERFERPYLIYYGNHGLEFWRNGQVQILDTVHPWREPLRSLLADLGTVKISGVVVENKEVTASIHYRLAADPAQAKDLLYRQLAPLCATYGLRLSEGQFVWEIKPPVQNDKGTAAHAIVKEYNLQSALFLGDDVTDYAAMQMLRQLTSDSEGEFQALSVGVVHPTTPPELFAHCDLTAEGIEDVTRLLRWLLDHRPAPTTELDTQ